MTTIFIKDVRPLNELKSTKRLINFQVIRSAVSLTKRFMNIQDVILLKLNTLMTYSFDLNHICLIITLYALIFRQKIKRSILNDWSRISIYFGKIYLIIHTSL